MPCDPSELDLLRHIKANIDFYADLADTDLQRAKRNGARDDIQATYDDAAALYGARDSATVQVKAANAEAARVSKACTGLKDDANKILEEVKKTSERIDAAKKAVDTVLDALPHDPPIDSISHSVQFVVAFNGNVTPSWSLVRIKGPSATGNFLSGTYTTTHTLNIAMGSPSTLPAEQARQLNNLVVIQNLGQPRPAQ